MIIKISTVLNRKDKKPILIDYNYNTEVTKQPILLFCHGYKGFKDWGAWNQMATQITKAGFCVIKFNFSHNGGTIDNPIDFPDLEAFGQNNYTKELDDLNDVLNWIETTFNNNQSINSNQINLMGHSRGGGITLIKTAEDSRIKKLISLASVSNFASRFGSEEDIKKWKKNGVKHIQNGRTKQLMPHFYQFFEDFTTNKIRLHIESATKKINIPHLIIHGEDDTAVPISEAHEIKTWNPKAKLKLIKNADHVFNIKHPWNQHQLNDAFQECVNEMISFLKNN